MRRRTTSALLALATLLGVAGCEAIPGSGAVETGLSDLYQVEQFVQFNPLGPVAGSSEEDIVRGFLLAATSPDDNYAVAREFLAPEYATQWDPHFGVFVDEGSRPFTMQTENAGSLELSTLARVDEQGQLLPTPPGQTTDLRFEFEEAGGEWRISSAPAGVVLDRTTFTAIWSPHQLYFIGARDVLVPETRWYPSRAALPTRIVSGLLAGTRTGEAVVSAFPPGTELITDAVPVVDGQARVDLSSDILDAGTDALMAMHRQLRDSLRTVPEVSGVEIYADGTAVRLPEIEGENDVVALPEAKNPVLLMDDSFGVLLGGEVEPIPNLTEAVVAADPSAITLSSDETVAVVRNEAGITMLSAGEPVIIDIGTGFLEPSIDAFGYVWTHRTGEPEVTATDPTGRRVGIRVPWLANLSPVVIEVSPDGARIAALVADDRGGSAVLVASIVRDANGVPLRTSETAETQMYVDGAPVDFDWVDSLRFATLTRTGTVGKVSVGGPGLLPSEQGSVPGGAHLSSGGSRAQLRVLAEDGDLYVAQGSGWQRAIGEVRVLAR